MSNNFELDECDRVILLYLYLVGRARLRDIVETLDEKCNSLNGRDAFYRRIKRRLMKIGLVEKEKVGERISHYYLTQKGTKYVAKGVTSKNEIKMLIEKIANKHHLKKAEGEQVEHVRFDMVLQRRGKNVYIKIVEGFTIPPNEKQFLETLKAIENSKEKWKHIEKLRKHLETIVNEKMHVANLVNLAQRHPDKQYTLIIIGTDPRKIPSKIKNQISQTGKHINELLDKALERIEKLQKQGPKNLRIIFTNRKTIQEIEKYLMK